MICCIAAALAAFLTMGHPASGLDRPPGNNQVSYAPADGAITSIDPPAFVWVPAPDASAYVLQYARNPDFSDAVTVPGIHMSVYTPTQTLGAGAWYWRYGFERDGVTAFSRARRFEIPADAVAFPRPPIEDVLQKVPQTRPRLYFTPEKVAEIRAEAEGKYAAIVGPVARSAEARIGEDLYPEPPMLPRDRDERRTLYTNIFRTMRPFTAGMETSALAYIYTGDRRFAEEAKRRLLHFATWDVEGSSSVFHNTEPAMDIAMRGPRTYDWIYDILTEEERRICKDFLGRRIAQLHRMHRRMPFESRPYSSHPGRMVVFVVEGSLVFAHEVPEARVWLDDTLRLLWSVYPAWGSDDGGWHEGVSYWNYYVNWLISMVGELDRMGIAIKDRPFFQNTGYFGLYAAYPHRKHRAFGDGYEGRVDRGHANLLYALGNLYDNPYFLWYAEQMNARIWGPQAIYLSQPGIAAKPPADLPQARAFPHVGWVAMHSKMAEPENNVMLLFQSSPYGSVSHNHAIQNAFVLEAFTEPLAISSGYYQEYGSPHHAQWVQQTRAHNSVLVNGEGQISRSTHAKGRIAAFENTDEFCYTAGDAAQAYGDRLTRFVRHILFARPDYFVICDELEAREASTYQWLLHAKSEMALAPEHNRVTLAQENARLQVRFLTPERLDFQQTTGFDPLPVRADSPAQFHFTASTTAPSKTGRFLTVLFPYKSETEGHLPECEPVAAQGGLALRVGQDLILWRDPGAARVEAQGMTSASTVAVFRPDATGRRVEVFSANNP